MRTTRRWTTYAGVGVLGCALLAAGCRGAVFDAAAAGALDLLHGTVAGMGGQVLFGESPSPLLLNSILNSIGSGGGGGGGGGHH